ncbi:MAG: hypothetical protein ACKO6L_00155 [Flavobacteriales bacterium]
MREVHLHDEAIEPLIREVFSSAFPVVLMELRGVFGLLAPHTREGAAALNRAKERKTGKHYGSIAGNLDALIANANADSIIQTPEALNILEGCFIRFSMKNQGLGETICNGTHQVLIEESGLRAVIQSWETQGPEVFPIPYPLCTSANLSGHVEGSITELSKALDFGLERGVPLFIHTGMLGNQTGSYPIIEELEQGELRLARKCPDGDAILAALNTLQHSANY